MEPLVFNAPQIITVVWMILAVLSTLAQGCVKHQDNPPALWGWCVGTFMGQGVFALVLYWGGYFSG